MEQDTQHPDSLVPQNQEAEVEKVVSYEIEGGKLVVLVDTDKNGKPLLKLELDISEGFQEALAKLGKK